ncbi:hypothetical protein J6590_011453 [Homalodisca vitripennis]|nr:hypothetical protein J6590_011453 [Homalodisca vitripennis]
MDDDRFLRRHSSRISRKVRMRVYKRKLALDSYMDNQRMFISNAVVYRETPGQSEGLLINVMGGNKRGGVKWNGVEKCPHV